MPSTCWCVGVSEDDLCAGKLLLQNQIHGSIPLLFLHVLSVKMIGTKKIYMHYHLLDFQFPALAEEAYSSHQVGVN